MVSKTLDPVPFPTGHENLMAQWLMASWRSWRLWQPSPARTNASQPTPTPHSHALPCCHVLSMPRASCTLRPLPSSLSPSSQIHPAFTLSRYPVPLSLPTALPLHPASPAGRFTHRVPQTGSNARLGFPLINTNPLSITAFAPSMPLGHEDYPPVGNTTVRQTVSNPMRCRRNCTETESPFTWNGLIAACRSRTYVTSTCHLQHEQAGKP